MAHTLRYADQASWTPRLAEYFELSTENYRRSLPDIGVSVMGWMEAGLTLVSPDHKYGWDVVVPVNRFPECGEAAKKTELIIGSRHLSTEADAYCRQNGVHPISLDDAGLTATVFAYQNAVREQQPMLVCEGVTPKRVGTLVATAFFEISLTETLSLQQRPATRRQKLRRHA